MIQTTKRTLRKITKGQKGQALPVVLILLVIGGLLIVPTLRYASTSLKAHQVVESKTLELYAADSGIEAGLWKLKNGETTILPYDLNNCDVEVTIEEIPPEAITDTQRQTFNLSDAALVYEVTSTATTSSGSGTTTESYIALTTEVTVGEDWTRFPDGYTTDMTVIKNDVLFEGDGTVSGGYIEGDVIFTGDGTVSGGYIEGDVCTGGDLTLIQGYIKGDVFVAGDLTLNQSYIIGDAYVGGTLTPLSGGSYITGDYPLPYEGCPLGTCVTTLEIVSFNIT